MKKMIVLLAGTLGLFVLTGCTNNVNSEIATMRGGNIGVTDFYQAAFLDPALGQSFSGSRKQANEQLLQEMIVKKVFVDAYGDKVSEARIEEMYNEQEATYGGKEAFQQALQASGWTKKDFQEMIRESLAIEAGLKEHMEIGEAELDAAWEDFHPEVKAQLIQVSEEEQAKELLEAVQANEADFEEVANEHSEQKETAENGGTITFDSTSDEVPSEVKNVAFYLGTEELSSVIPVINPTTNQTSYYLIKVIDKEEKGTDQSKYKEKLTEIAQSTLLTDSEFVKTAIGKELQEADIYLKEERFSDLLSDYLRPEDIDESTKNSTENP
ncbi:peptidylprolyl isomerase [Enterococcus innesii]|uniref:peptidylprolyl isomerase n=1 Tax=Enterococcus innesii TaxID=2839759 RepID=UPI0022B9D37B|nr:peptidylprolyl isomerase [Enterococcus innesii]